MKPSALLTVVQAYCLRERELLFKQVRYHSRLRQPTHLHEEASIVFQVEGAVQLECRGQSRLIEPSALVFVPAYEPHANLFPEDGRTLEIVLGAGWLERAWGGSGLDSTSREFRDGPSAWLAVRLLRELRDPDDLTPLTVEGLILELLAQMRRDAGAAPSKSAAGDAPSWLGRAKDYLHAYFLEGPSLDTVAAAVGVHPDHLTRAFRRHYRSTLGDYVRRLRVEHACRLLSTTDTPLAHVALEAGFADQGHFTRTFKGLTSMTPAQYRKTSGRAGSG